MRILKFKNGTFNTYKSLVRGNENISEQQARLKMTRNMLLSNKEKHEHLNGTLYKYGSLWFIVKWNKITWIDNHMQVPSDWRFDEVKYLELSRSLGIEKKNYKH